MESYYFRVFKDITLRELDGVTVKKVVFIVVMAFLLVYIPAVILYIKNKKMDFGRVFREYLLISYTGIIFLITVFRRRTAIHTSGVNLKVLELNFYDNKKMARIVFYYILNIALFVPFGIILLLILRKKKVKFAVLKTFICSLLLSLTIEIIQRISGMGVFELSDILMNTIGGGLGAIIGFVALLFCEKK